MGGSGLVVDWPSEKRAALEVALKERQVVAVRVKGDEVELVPGCVVMSRRDFHEAAGWPLQYGDERFSPKSDVLELRDADAIRASLPATSTALVARVEGDLKRGASLELALVARARLSLRGERPVHASQVLSKRGESCAPATHVIATVTLGAFALRTNTDARVHTAAEVFGAGAEASSDSTRKMVTKDGDIEACTGDGKACSVPLRIELIALDPRSEHEGRCSDKGETPSCVAWLLNSTTVADAERALVQVRAHCSKDEPIACNGLVLVASATSHPLRDVVGPAEADRAASIGCMIGAGFSCSHEAARLEREGDFAAALVAHVRPCVEPANVPPFDSGAFGACYGLLAYAERHKPPATAPLSYAYAVLCLNNSGELCGKYQATWKIPVSNALQEKLHVPATHAIAQCQQFGNPDECRKASAMLALGLGVPKDVTKARAVWKARCQSLAQKGETCEPYPAGW